MWTANAPSLDAAGRPATVCPMYGKGQRNLLIAEVRNFYKLARPGIGEDGADRIARGKIADLEASAGGRGAIRDALSRMEESHALASRRDADQFDKIDALQLRLMAIRLIVEPSVAAL